MSALTQRIIDKLIRDGVIPPEHRQDAGMRLERDLRRRTRWIASGLAREAAGAVALARASA